MPRSRNYECNQYRFLSTYDRVIDFLVYAKLHVTNVRGDYV